MGDFSLSIKAVGGHGCDREAKQGESITYRTDPAHVAYCPDCKIRQFVESIKGMLPEYGDYHATLTHWPGEPSEVVDDVLKGVRVKGAFK